MEDQHKKNTKMEKNARRFKFVYFDKNGEKLFSVINVRLYTLKQAIAIAEYLCLDNNGQFSIEVKELEEKSQDEKINL